MPKFRVTYNDSAYDSDQEEPATIVEAESFAEQGAWFVFVANGEPDEDGILTVHEVHRIRASTVDEIARITEPAAEPD